jgi:hypothetical protein
MPTTVDWVSSYLEGLVQGSQESVDCRLVIAGNDGVIDPDGQISALFCLEADE